MSFLSEADIEKSTIDYLVELGYTLSSDAALGPEGKASERASYADVILEKRLIAAIDRLNPTLPPDAKSEALRKILATERPSLIEENKRLHTLMVDGVPVEFYTNDGIRGDKVRLIDFDNNANNDWLAVRQVTVIERSVQRRADIVVFLNGLPFGVIELKAPCDEKVTLRNAFMQLQTYKKQIPALFRTNVVLVIADGMTARVGSLTADYERFMPWRTITGEDLLPKGQPELETLIKGVFDPKRFLTLLHYFTAFGETPSGGIIKIIAGYHQFHAVQRAVEKTVEASSPQGDRKVGVIWHTQGSGKSLLMVFYVGALVQQPELENPTIVVITDRNDLDTQLFQTFSMYRELIRQTPYQADSRENLQSALSRVSGGVIFTTIQKLSPEKIVQGNGEMVYPVLSTRRNIIVIADEAHRSQYGFNGKIDQKTGQMGYGFAKYLRDALPNASFIGFTGTPIEKVDANTRTVFGDYIDTYDINRAVEDGATVPIYYESRLARIELPEEEKPKIDLEIDLLTEDEALDEQERIKRKWAAVERLVGAEKRLAMVAQDLVQHFEQRTKTLDGKAMVVCMSRRICIALYHQIMKLRPEWHSENDNEGSVKVVMTGSASDPNEWQTHIGNKTRRDLLAKRMKDPKDPLKLVIVRDMWLTGFDVPAMHTMYIDKPMQGHGLMQAIARVNRVFHDKPAGLVVDYIGIGHNLKKAICEYSDADKRQVGIDEQAAIAVMLEKYESVKAMYHGFDYMRGLQGTPHERLVVLGDAIEWILSQQNEAAAQETTETGKKRANRRYQDAVLALSKAFALASASDEARAIRDEVAFFQAVRQALVKTAVKAETHSEQQEMAIQQILDRAIMSTEIVDILSVAGIKAPDISVLSEEFLSEVQHFEKKNLALEALRKLLNDEIRSRSKTNVVEAKRFSERLEMAINRYHMNTISAFEAIQELLDLSKEVCDSHRRGEENGLSQEEMAFYDALAENQNAVEVMGNEKLKVIAHELLEDLKNNVSVDWTHRESIRARMRLGVKKILRKYGYPPDLQDTAVQTVLRQAEAVSSQWLSS